MESLCHETPDGYDYPPSLGALGWVAAVPAVAAGVASVWQSIGGIFGGGDSGSEKLNKALSGWSAPGPFDEVSLATALQRAPPSAAASVQRAVESKSFLTASQMGFTLDPEHLVLARLAVFLGHGGIDGQLGPAEQQCANVVRGVMETYAQPDYASNIGLPAVQVPAPTGALPPPPEWLTEFYESWTEEAAPPLPAEKPPVTVAGMPLKTLALYGGLAFLAARALKVI